MRQQTQQSPDVPGAKPRPRREHGLIVAFRPGQSVMVQGMGDAQRYWGRIVGVDGLDFFIVKMPLVPGVMRLAAAGTALTLRLEHEGELFGFSCDVLACTHKPSPLLILSYPTSAERLQLRRHKRVKCLLPALVENDFFTSPGFIVDLSRGGCRLVLDMFQAEKKIVNLMTGDEVRLGLSLDSRTSLPLAARVVAMNEAAGNRTVGASFASGQEDNLKALCEFMDRLEAIDAMLEQKA